MSEKPCAYETKVNLSVLEGLADQRREIEIEKAIAQQEREVAAIKSSKDYQVGGNHYRQAVVQPWDIIEAYNLNFWEGNALKYLLRRKNSRLEDLKKARHYIQYLIEREESK